MRDQTSQHNRPGVGHAIAIGLAYFIAVAAILTAVGLTVDDAYRNMDNSIIIGIDAIAATATGVAIQMHCSYLAQVRLLDGQAEILRGQAAIIKLIEQSRDELKSDTGQIPRLANTVVDAPEIILLEVPQRRYDQAPDRERVMQVIEETEQRIRDDQAEAAEAAYLDRYQKLTGDIVPRGPRAVPDAG